MSAVSHNDCCHDGGHYLWDRGSNVATVLSHSMDSYESDVDVSYGYTLTGIHAVQKD